MSPAVNVQKLAALVKTKRAGRPLRTVAEEIGEVSASTLSRVEQGNIPDLDTFMRLCAWLGVSADDFRDPASETDPTMAAPSEVIEAHLRADRNLPPDAIEALSQMIRFAYKAAADGKLKRPEGG
jgi:transcriptional regulator with XRE-family HTH domain